MHIKLSNGDILFIHKKGRYFLVKLGQRPVRIKEETAFNIMSDHVEELQAFRKITEQIVPADIFQLISQEARNWKTS